MGMAVGLWTVLALGFGLGEGRGRSRDPDPSCPCRFYYSTARMMRSLTSHWAGRHPAFLRLMEFDVESREYTGAENERHWVKEPEGFDDMVAFITKHASLPTTGTAE